MVISEQKYGFTDLTVTDATELEKTKVHYPGGGVAYADPLTSNRKAGTGTIDMPGWKHAQLLNKEQDLWRRGHMVSQALGGDGNLKNLSIISQSTNSKNG